MAIGLIVKSGGKIFYKFSKDKISLVSKVNNSNSELLKYTVGKVSDFIDSELKNEVSFFSKDVKVNLEYLDRLSIYNNGFLQFDKPSIINLDFNASIFQKFFNKYIELHLQTPKKALVDKTFKNTIDAVFRKPLQEIIDVNYKVKKEQIPGLFFDYTLDGIGVNGSLYSVKSIDFNSEKPLDTLRREISELESLNYRLDMYSDKLGLNKEENHHYLVVDPYVGTKSSYHRLYEILKDQSQNNDFYSVIDTSFLPKVTRQIKASPAIKKFSEFLESF